MSGISKLFKSNKGSITLYVVLSFLFLLVIIIGTYINYKVNETHQEEELERIQETYQNATIIVN